MYIRIKTTPNSPRQSVQIVESVRVDGKVRQRIVRHVGIANDADELVRLRELAEYVRVKLEETSQPDLFDANEKAQAALARATQRDQPAAQQPLPVDLRHLREEKRVVKGFTDIYGALYSELGFDTVFPKGRRYAKAHEILRHMVLARIAQPGSKRASAALIEQDWGITVSLEKVYRMMDNLDEDVQARMQQRVFSATQSLLPQPVNVVFYDCTTLYFESFTEDELKQNGYSKDGKFNQAQVLLALMVTPEGLPVGYELFPGATFEGHTLKLALDRLAQRYTLEQVILVADRGLLSDANLAHIEQSGYHYIVGARLRSLPKTLQDYLVEPQHYQPAGSSDIAERLLETAHQARRLIVGYSDKRARKDRHDREKAIEALRKKLSKSRNPKALLNNYGYKKYLNVQGEAALILDEDKLAQEARWDGLHGVITNLLDTQAEQVLAHYRSLWHIEEAFRVTKHHLEARPIYHWTPKRVRAHVAICYMAFACVTHLRYRIALQKRLLSVDAIRNALMHAQVSWVKDIHTGQRYAIPSGASPDAVAIYRAMGQRWSDVPYSLD